MNRFINIPNIPEKKVSTVLVDYRISSRSIQKLNDLNINVIKTTPITNLYEAIKGHADIMFHHIQDDIFVVAPEVYSYFKNILPNSNIVLGTTTLKSNYPDNIAYNIARVGKCAFHKLQYTDTVIREYYEQLGVTLIDVKQGYSKCCTCILNENAIITADKSIANKADNYNIDVLLISNGEIILKGLDYGFIGGSTGLISKNILAVNGNLQYHIDYDKISQFCNKYRITICPLHNGKTEDIGSIIPLFY